MSILAPPRRGEYGYDAPYALIAFGIVGSLLALAAVAIALGTRRARAALMLGLYGGFFLANAASFFYTTRKGKFQVWDEILNGLRLRGDERALDIGCGRGAVLTAVAARLTRGRVTGVDLWSRRDQSGNSDAVTRRNAALEHVSDRADLATGDMRMLPFRHASFDLVVSSLAIHNISSRAERRAAVAEAWRVLKPGGRLVIADIRATRHYARTLAQLGAPRVDRRGLGWRFWYGNPMARTSLVVAEKPKAPPEVD
jgi:arsenite methyltransferase